MHDLTAQVTSSLIPFPGVTLNALGEDEITLDSVLQGKFTVGRSGLAWLSCGPHLETVHTATGERLSAYSFSGGGEHPPCILAAKDFSWLKRSGLLIGLEEAEGSVLCLYDLGLSRVVKAVVIPGRITYIEPLVSYGGASASTQHLHQSLRWFFGIAAVGTDLGHVLLVDLCLDDLSCSQSELEASDLQVVTKSPAEIPKLREVSCREGRHLCLQLNGATGVGATALQYISRTNQLAVGFSDGYMHLWNMKALKKEYHSQLEGGKVPVNAFTFQEPENDPRNCCYLWAVQSSQDLEGDMVSLHLLQLAFSERKCSGSGKILYEGLEYCEERYSQELSGTAFPLRAQATNTRLLSCQTIEKFRPHLDRDDSMNEISSPDTSVSIFIWQVKAYGQGTPATFIGVFDINRWYHAQMPDSLRAGESLQNCPYLAVWSLNAVMEAVSPHMLLDVLVNERSLSRGLPHTCPPPEQYFNPTTYNFDATCLLNTGIVHLTCSGYQKEALGFLKKAAPCSSDVIASIYSRCLMSGLLSSRLTDTQASSLSQEEQLDAILCTAVETSSLGLITGCIKQWTAEEQPGSALNLRYILDWAWSKVVQTKEELDGICAPLFDSSSNFTDPQTMQLLQHCQRLLTNLSTIFNCLLCEAHELTQKGLVGLMNKNMVSGLISKYAQVVLWFCRTGLLPEGSVEDALQISRPFYSHSIISNYYSIRREELKRLAKGKWCADCLMIDGLVDQCGERLVKLWKRDEGGTGQYPPPTLHALLDIYLLDNIDEATKHAIVIYLLLDVMYAFSNKDGASVESFPTAFAIPIGLVKLIQGLWLLDHHDHQSAFELLLHPAASQCPFVWQHERVLQALMCQGQHAEALRYFHVTKPIMVSTSQAKLCLLVLLHNRCLIEAWSLARQHSNHLNISELLGFLFETCQELGLIKELLKLPLGLSEQESLEKFLQGTGGLQNRELLMVHYLQQANYIPALQLNHSLKMNLVNERDPKLKEQSNIRNAILDQYGKVLPRVQRQLAMERAKPYQRPPTIHKEVSRPKPLSTISKRSASENVISRAGFINNLLTKIEEVWIGRDSPQSSPIKSPKTMARKCPTPKLSSTLPEPFLGTPITMSAKRKSRLMKLVVQPSQMPQALLSPPRPPTSWVSPKRVSNAPELSLLQTPQVVKRARALAASGPVFAAFTPQSILRTSLRPTPVATPSASPRRSVTPPPRKENRITFIEATVSPEMEKSIPWTNGEASDDEIRLLTRGALLSKATRKSWSSQAEDEEVERQEEEDVHEKPLSDEMTGGSVSPHQTVSNPPSVHYDTEETKTSGAQLVLSFETSHTSVRSTDTTLEFYDAPLAEEPEDDKYVDRDNGIVSSETPEEDASKSQTQVHSEETFEEALPQEESEGLLGDHDDVEFEGIPETNWDQEATNEALIIANSEQDTSDGCNDLIGASVSQPADVCEQSFIHESAEEPEALKPSEHLEPTNRPEQELEQSADLTEFVQKHLFGDDLSLTRSGIHSVSLAQTSINSDFVDQEAEEEQTASSTAPVFPSRKSTTSITSSEPTGTDSHSVFSINDSEDLSRPVSEEDCEDEEEDDEEEEDEEDEEEEEEEDGEDDEEEDSGSEVEIIEEIQGRPPPALSSEYIVQEQSHCLPNLLEQEAEAFSSEIKTAEEDGIGEVVMVHLGTDEQDMDQDEEVAQAASYLELKPSSTLLVPLELVEEQDISAEQVPNDIFQTDVSNDHKTESQSSFSLTLDLEEDGDKEPETNLMNNPLSTQVLLTEIKEMEEPVASVEVKLLVNEVLDAEIKEMENPVATVEVKPPVDEVLDAEIKEMDEPVATVEVKLPVDEVLDAEIKEMDEPVATVEVKPSADEVLDAEIKEMEEPVAPVEVKPPVDEVLDAEIEEPVARVEVKPPVDEVLDAEIKEMEEPVAPVEVKPPVDEVLDAKIEEPVARVEVKPPVDEVLDAEIKEMEEPVARVEVTPPVDEVLDAEIKEVEEPVARVEVTPPVDEVLDAEIKEMEEPVARVEVTPPVDEVLDAEIKEVEEPVAPVEIKPSVDEVLDAEIQEVEEPVALAGTEDVDQVEINLPEPVFEEGHTEFPKVEIPIESDIEIPKEVEALENLLKNEKMAQEESELFNKDMTEENPSEEKVQVSVQVGEHSEVYKVEEISDAPLQVENKMESSHEPEEPLKEAVPSKSEDAQQSEQDTASVNAQEEETESRQETKRTGNKGRSKKQDQVVVPVQRVDLPDKQSESSDLSRKTKAPNTPTRRTTRANRTVTFISPAPEETHNTEREPENKVEMEHEHKTNANPLARLTRRSKPVKEIISTPRRSTRRTQPEPQEELREEQVEDVSDNTVSSTTKTLSPGRTRGSQRNSSRSSQKIHSEEAETNPEAEVKQEEVVTHSVEKSPGRSKTPVKRKVAQSTTPRRSSRRTGIVSENVPHSLETLEELEEQKFVSATPVKVTTQKTKPEPTQTVNKENDDLHSPSHARTTRQSNRITLSVYPQVKLVPLLLPQSVKRRAAKGQDQSEPEPKRDVDSLHKTKKKLWDQPEQEQPLLDPPLEVDSETPVADALIKRLYDEKQKLEVTKSTRSSKKSVTLPEAPLVNCALFDTDDNASQGESSFIYSPSRSKTRAKAVESPSRTGPVTRSRKAVSSVDLEVEMAEENPVEEASVPNTRKTSKRTKPKAALEPTLIAEVDLLSPLPSPADPVRRAQKRTKEVDGPTSTMNFQRKRIMGTVLTKPVTRRKKL